MVYIINGGIATAQLLHHGHFDWHDKRLRCSSIFTGPYIDAIRNWMCSSALYSMFISTNINALGLVSRFFFVVVIIRLALAENNFTHVYKQSVMMIVGRRRECGCNLLVIRLDVIERGLSEQASAEGFCLCIVGYIIKRVMVQYTHRNLSHVHNTKSDFLSTTLPVHLWIARCLFLERHAWCGYIGSFHHGFLILLGIDMHGRWMPTSILIHMCVTTNLVSSSNLGHIHYKATRCAYYHVKFNASKMCVLYARLPQALTRTWHLTKTTKKKRRVFAYRRIYKCFVF